jgi:hypothetical protein
VIAAGLQKIASFPIQQAFYLKSCAFLDAFSSLGCLLQSLATCRVKCFYKIPAYSFETFFRFVHYTLGSTRTPR